MQLSTLWAVGRAQQIWLLLLLSMKWDSYISDCRAGGCRPLERGVFIFFNAIRSISAHKLITLDCWNGWCWPVRSFRRAAGRIFHNFHIVWFNGLAAALNTKSQWKIDDKANRILTWSTCALAECSHYPSISIGCHWCNQRALFCWAPSLWNQSDWGICMAAASLAQGTTAAVKTFAYEPIIITRCFSVAALSD